MQLFLRLLQAWFRGRPPTTRRRPAYEKIVGGSSAGTFPWSLNPRPRTRTPCQLHRPDKPSFGAVADKLGHRSQRSFIREAIVRNSYRSDRQSFGAVIDQIRHRLERSWIRCVIVRSGHRSDRPSFGAVIEQIGNRSERSSIRWAIVRSSHRSDQP